MTQTVPDSNGHSASEPDSKRTPFSFRKSWIAIAIFTGLAIAAQTRDLLNDRSVSNIATGICLAFALLIFFSVLFRWVSRKTSPVVAAILAVIIISSPATLLRLKGFYGAMFPILEFRFKSTADLQETEIDSADSPDDLIVAATSFHQFLGTDRNAVIPTREFSVPTTGNAEEIWRVQVGDGWSSFAVVDQYCVTLEQRDEQECVAAYRLADGKLLWINRQTARHENPLGGIGPRSTPAVVNDLVYTCGATGIVQCVKLATGELVWKQELLTLAGWEQTASEASITWGRAPSPLVTDGLCIIPFGRPYDSEPTAANLSGRSLIAFDAASGEVRWCEGDDQISYASPVMMTLGDVKQIVSVNETTVTGHQVNDGKVLWKLDWPGQSNGGANCSSAIQFENDSFLISKGYGVGSGVFKVSQAKGDQWAVKEVWTSNRVLKTKFTHACLDGNIAYGLSDGMLECVDVNDGKQLWAAKARDSRYGHGQMLRVGDCLVVQAETGTVAFVAATPDEFKPLFVVEALNGRTWNVPTIAGRFLIVRNDTEAVMYRLPELNKSTNIASVVTHE